MAGAKAHPKPRATIPEDPLTPDLMLLSAFRRLIPGKPALTSVYKWCHKGVLNKETGKRVKLKTIRTPSGVCVTRQLYREFLLELNAES